MAEQHEEIIIINEADAAGIEYAEEVSKEEVTSDIPKKVLFSAIGLLALLLCVVIIITLMPSKQPSGRAMDIETIETKLKDKPVQPVPASKIEKMIAKANFLYSNGNKEEALSLYERIALYSEALSQYNLGVAQLKEGQYEKALSTFKKAVTSGDNRCVSAINAAVCALHLEDNESFNYYINLAQAFLPYETKSPLYSYYYALINYYKGNYFEVLSALQHPTSTEYPLTQNHLLSKINTLFGDYYGAISALERSGNERDAFSLGLLYANVGDLTLAKKHLSEAILRSGDPLNEQLALALIYLKSGLPGEGGKLLKTLTDMYGEEVYKPYPVKVFLKASLFDPSTAQQHYRNTLIKKKMSTYQKIFYFAPYKVFNAFQTISYIRKGTANIYIDDISNAKEYLKKSSQTSTINYGIAQAIKQSLSFRLRDANTRLKKLLEGFPKHSILHYNLALTYAQMGDMTNAYEHFLRSYHLDAGNYLSGIFALMTAQLVNIETPKLLSIIKENLAQEEESEETMLYNTLFNISQDNYIGTLKWLENDFQERPLYLAMNILIATQVGKSSIAQKASEKLCYQLPNDILPHILYIDTHFDTLPNKAYAKSVLSYLKDKDFAFDDLYYGPFITRHLYTQLALITGRLYPLRIQLKEKLSTTDEAPQDIMGALALASIYDESFEEAYTLYNQIIDDYKVQDPLTLFLGAVASTGAEHHANAIGLLELAKLKDKRFLESRYALGLLYLQVKNNRGASVQLQQIGNTGFVSEYFNFMIDTDALLLNKQKAPDTTQATQNFSKEGATAL